MPSGPKIAFFCDSTNIAMIPAITAAKERIIPSIRSERESSLRSLSNGSDSVGEVFVGLVGTDHSSLEPTVVLSVGYIVATMPGCVMAVIGTTLISFIYEVVH